MAIPRAGKRAKVVSNVRVIDDEAVARMLVENRQRRLMMLREHLSRPGVHPARHPLVRLAFYTSDEIQAQQAEVEHKDGEEQQLESGPPEIVVSVSGGAQEAIALAAVESIEAVVTGEEQTSARDVAVGGDAVVPESGQAQQSSVRDVAVGADAVVPGSDQAQQSAGGRAVATAATSQFRMLPAPASKKELKATEYLKIRESQEKAEVESASPKESESIVAVLTQTAQKKKKAGCKAEETKCLSCASCHETIPLTGQWYACVSCMATYHRTHTCLAKLTSNVHHVEFPDDWNARSKRLREIQLGIRCVKCIQVQDVGLVCKQCRRLTCMSCFDATFYVDLT